MHVLVTRILARTVKVYDLGLKGLGSSLRWPSLGCHLRLEQELFLSLLLSECLLAGSHAKPEFSVLQGLGLVGNMSTY